MRIACLQFAPERGVVSKNIDCVDKILDEAHPQNVDLLVLPEMAFAGKNFTSFQHISSCLEQKTSGITMAWARYTALENNCVVVIGYPEKTDVAGEKNLKCYNSAIAIDSDGNTIANHRKCLLDDMDRPWALGGSDQFSVTTLPNIGKVAIAIGQLTAYEFACHILINDVNIAIISMAWKIQDPNIGRGSEEPDWDTLLLWIERLDPLVRAKNQGEIVIVIANCYGADGEATYAGTSCVLSIEDGVIKVYNVLGYGEQKLLVVDTSQSPRFTLVTTASQGEREIGWLRHLQEISSSKCPPHETTECQKNHSATTSISSSPLDLSFVDHLETKPQGECSYVDQ